MRGTFLQPPNPNILPQSQHKHRDSSSTQNSDYSDMSPTTSATSTSAIYEPIVSCPDSPVVLSPIKPFSALGLGLPTAVSVSMLSVNDKSTAEPKRPKTSPTPRRARNMKNLSIMPPVGTSSASSLASEPASPSFIKPFIPGIKRRPSNLSLDTNTKPPAGQPPREITLSPVSQPTLQARGLKHSISTPQMLAGLKSSTFAPPGGMTFPTVLERNESGLSEVLRPTKINAPPAHELPVLEEEGQITTQVADRGALDADDRLRDESEKHEDLKSPTYPDGPVAIYDNDVFLYLEPNAEEASQFDVVINVAREVKNPFSHSHNRPSSPCPDTAVTTASFSTALEFHAPEADSASTSRAATPKPKIPHYIHMPWDHNTDISVDLMHLCEKIDGFVKQRKRVLIHCQQGASRSASLIIAYGLYRNPELTVNDAYHAAQSKSRWISPNMKLMYCLQDFQKEVSLSRKPFDANRLQRIGRSPTKHRLTLSADVAGSSVAQEPLTAPLMNDCNFSELGSSATHLRGNSCPTSIHVVPGPSSAPSNLSWPRDKDVEGLPRFPRFSTETPESQASGQPQLKISDYESSSPTSQHATATRDASAAQRNTVNFSRPMTWSKPPPSPGFPPPMGFAAPGFPPSFKSAPPDQPSRAETKAPLRSSNAALVSHAPADFLSDHGILSPRAEVMTSNPLRHVLREPGAQTTTLAANKTAAAAFKFVEPPASMDDGAGLFSPIETVFPANVFRDFERSEMSDPRSPPTKGEAPIVRSIDEFLG
ncbi:uncharacterized protein BROUX77_004732 [Berkeleyomyces rouxiae]|uniref:uncharacterized protein n=1 Tax=Berkeleyomyces rouxiae TaxID=2035830 RepID=UPI003B81977D